MSASGEVADEAIVPIAIPSGSFSVRTSVPALVYWSSRWSMPQIVCTRKPPAMGATPRMACSPCASASRLPPSGPMATRRPRGEPEVAITNSRSPTNAAPRTPSDVSATRRHPVAPRRYTSDGLPSPALASTAAARAPSASSSWYSAMGE